MTLRLGDTAPDFRAHATEGPIRFHDWIGDSWAGDHAKLVRDIEETQGATLNYPIIGDDDYTVSVLIRIVAQPDRGRLLAVTAPELERVVGGAR